MDLAELRHRIGDKEFNIAVSWAKRRGWISIERSGDRVVVRLLQKPGELPEERVLRLLKEGERELDEFPEELRAACLSLATRPNVLTVKVKRVHVMKPTRKLLELDSSILESRRSPS